MIRQDAQLTVSRFAELIGIPRRTYHEPLKKLRAGDAVKGRGPHRWSTGSNPRSNGPTTAGARFLDTAQSWLVYRSHDPRSEASMAGRHCHAAAVTTRATRRNAVAGVVASATAPLTAAASGLVPRKAIIHSAIMRPRISSGAHSWS